MSEDGTGHVPHDTNHQRLDILSQPLSPSSLERNVSPRGQLADMNEDRRKRRRTDSATAETLLIQTNGQLIDEPRRSARASAKDKVYTFAPDIGFSTGLHKDGSQAGVAISRTDETGFKESKIALPTDDDKVDPILTSTTTNGQVRDRQKKLLLFNPKTGTIGSPPAKKTTPKEKSTKIKQKTSQLVTISYGDEAVLPKDIGVKIAQILSSPSNPNLTPKKRHGKQSIKDTPKNFPSAKLAKSPPKPGKALHPLFAGKPKAVEQVAPSRQVPVKVPPNPNIISLTTPKRPASLPTQTATKASFAGFGHATKITKIGGALQPAWPWKGSVHVRGPGRIQDVMENKLEHDYHKAKFTPTVVADEENLLQCLSKELDIRQILDAVNGLDMESWSSPPPWLHLPTKHLESGHWLQNQLRQQLRYGSVSRRTDIADSPKPLLSEHVTKPQHPALSRVFNLVATSFSAFDVGASESQTWMHKYSPKTTADVLQTGQEALILHDWLKNLVVTSVEGGIDQLKGNRHIPSSTKRKRKSKRVDDFIVSDGESEDEISENEGDFGVNRAPTLCNTVVRSGRKSSKLKNAVLISGPSGCGKSATVYAVAKELGFEIFEINPGSRRSGKDILEKVGDMAKNHLVHGQNNITIPTATLTPDVNEDEKFDQALADDISSGRQGTMNSFFTVKEKSKSKHSTITVKNSDPTEVEKPSTLRDMPLFKPAKKHQKQSLILLEEVDILYEEDKNFWMTVLGLIISSRRPLIMTCNNESGIQADLDEHLHAILRLTAPPVDLAADYLLLVAAAEGHLLKHTSVKKLYESRSHDLRASLADLNFWCQFGIGDQKHGGDWYYRRQTGQDLGVDGQPVRVISEESYSSGLEWISSDMLASSMTSALSNHLGTEEEVLEELWDRFGLEPCDSLSSSALHVQRVAQLTLKEDTLSALQLYEQFTEALSSADICANGAFASDKQLAYDPSHPLLPTKSMDDFPLGSQLLQAPIMQQYQPLAKHISVALSARAHKLLDPSTNLAILSTRAESLPDDHICSHINNPTKFLTRGDLCLAFDPISFSPVATSLITVLSGGSSLDPSVFDRTTSIITTDVAPYVRGIVNFEARLQEVRLERSGLLSQIGTGKPKKARMTRSAMSAVEGGARGTTRRVKWFEQQLNSEWVSKTGGAWGTAVVEEEGRRRTVAIKALQHSQTLAQARMEDLNKQEMEKPLMSEMGSQVTEE